MFLKFKSNVFVLLNIIFSEGGGVSDLSDFAVCWSKHKFSFVICYILQVIYPGISTISSSFDVVQSFWRSFRYTYTYLIQYLYAQVVTGSPLFDSVRWSAIFEKRSSCMLRS